MEHERRRLIDRFPHFKTGVGLRLAAALTWAAGCVALPLAVIMLRPRETDLLWPISVVCGYGILLVWAIFSAVAGRGTKLEAVQALVAFAVAALETPRAGRIIPQALGVSENFVASLMHLTSLVCLLLAFLAWLRSGRRGRQADRPAGAR